MPITPPKRPPLHFDLAPLTSFDPAELTQGTKEERELAGFIIALAIAFNDLKDLTWWAYLLASFEVPTGQEVPSTGQHAGMRVHIHRLCVGLLHEVLVLVEKNLRLTQRPDFLALLRGMASPARNAWDILVAKASGYKAKTRTADEKALGDLLERVRSSNIFHYNSRDALNGYDLFVKARPGSGQAYLSAGKDMEATRFYFADAAAQQLTNGLLGDAKVSVDSLEKDLRNLNLALNDIVRSYLRHRVKLSGAI
jgi:hypothetical protein